MDSLKAESQLTHLENTEEAIRSIEGMDLYSTGQLDFKKRGSGGPIIATRANVSDGASRKVSMVQVAQHVVTTGRISRDLTNTNDVTESPMESRVSADFSATEESKSAKKHLPAAPRLSKQISPFLQPALTPARHQFQTLVRQSLAVKNEQTETSHIGTSEMLEEDAAHVSEAELVSPDEVKMSKVSQTASCASLDLTGVTSTFAEAADAMLSTTSSLSTTDRSHADLSSAKESSSSLQPASLPEATLATIPSPVPNRSQQVSVSQLPLVHEDISPKKQEVKGKDFRSPSPTVDRRSPRAESPRLGARIMTSSPMATRKTASPAPKLSRETTSSSSPSLDIPPLKKTPAKSPVSPRKDTLQSPKLSRKSASSSPQLIVADASASEPSSLSIESSIAVDTRNIVAANEPPMIVDAGTAVNDRLTNAEPEKHSLHIDYRTLAKVTLLVPEMTGHKNESSTDETPTTFRSRSHSNVERVSRPKLNRASTTAETQAPPVIASIAPPSIVPASTVASRARVSSVSRTMKPASKGAARPESAYVTGSHAKTAK